MPKEHKGKTTKEYLRIALDRIADSASLPPYGAVGQVINICRSRSSYKRNHSSNPNPLFQNLHGMSAVPLCMYLVVYVQTLSELYLTTSKHPTGG